MRSFFLLIFKLGGWRNENRKSGWVRSCQWQVRLKIGMTDVMTQLLRPEVWRTSVMRVSEARVPSLPPFISCEANRRYINFQIFFEIRRKGKPLAYVLGLKLLLEDTCSNTSVAVCRVPSRILLLQSRTFLEKLIGWKESTFFILKVLAGYDLNGCIHRWWIRENATHRCFQHNRSQSLTFKMAGADCGIKRPSLRLNTRAHDKN